MPIPIGIAGLSSEALSNLSAAFWEARHTVYTIKYAQKDHRSNSKDIKTKGIGPIKEFVDSNHLKRLVLK